MSLRRGKGKSKEGLASVLLHLLKANSFSFVFAFHVYTLGRHAHENLNHSSSTLAASHETQRSSALLNLDYFLSRC
jgi:hypothetical protein